MTTLVVRLYDTEQACKAWFPLKSAPPSLIVMMMMMMLRRRKREGEWKWWRWWWWWWWWWWSCCWWWWWRWWGWGWGEATRMGSGNQWRVLPTKHFLQKLPQKDKIGLGATFLAFPNISLFHLKLVQMFKLVHLFFWTQVNLGLDPWVRMSIMMLKHKFAIETQPFEDDRTSKSKHCVSMFVNSDRSS